MQIKSVKQGGNISLKELSFCSTFFPLTTIRDATPLYGNRDLLLFPFSFLPLRNNRDAMSLYLIPDLVLGVAV